MRPICYEFKQKQLREKLATPQTGQPPIVGWGHAEEVVCESLCSHKIHERSRRAMQTRMVAFTGRTSQRKVDVRLYPSSLRAEQRRLCCPLDHHNHLVENISEKPSLRHSHLNLQKLWYTEYTVYICLQRPSATSLSALQLTTPETHACASSTNTKNNHNHLLTWKRT